MVEHPVTLRFQDRIGGELRNRDGEARHAHTNYKPAIKSCGTIGREVGLGEGQ